MTRLSHIELVDQVRVDLVFDDHVVKHQVPSNKKHQQVDQWLSIWLRPYQEESTTSRLISEVKSLWAWPVLGLATTWEHQVLKPLFFVCLFLFV